MKLRAFLATRAELPRALRDGIDGFTAKPLEGVDPANLSALFELVTRGVLPAEQALDLLDQPVADAGPNGPWIYAVPAEATAALAAASTSELDAWALDWAGLDATPADGSTTTVRALAALAAGAGPDQALLVRLDAEQGAKHLASGGGAGGGAKDLPENPDPNRS